MTVIQLGAAEIKSGATTSLGNASRAKLVSRRSALAASRFQRGRDSSQLIASKVVIGWPEFFIGLSEIHSALSESPSA